MKTPPPLSSELEALLAPHRKVLPLAPFVEARAVARAAAHDAGVEEWGAVRVSSRPRWVFALAAGFVLALGAGAYAARAWVAVPSAPVTPVARARALEPEPAVVVSPAPARHVAVVAAPAAPHVRRVVAKTSPAPAQPSNEELQLLRAARADAARGDFARALAVLSEHTRRFRNGALVEEREALRVRSLAGLGRHDEAQHAAAEFHARFPHSVFLSTFERMKGTDR
jgi:hypothetical protein